MIENLSIDERAKKRYYDLGYWSNRTLCDVWNKQASTFRDRVYVEDDLGGALTYGQVDEQARRLASWFEEVGVRNGDVVSFQIPKWIEFCIVYVACLKAGAVMHPIAMRCNGRDLDYLINQVGAKVYLCPTFHHKTDYEQQYLDVAEKLPTLEATMLIDRERPARTDLPILGDVLKTHAPAERPSPATSDEVACILSTSGTTGRPKAALCTHNTILFSERSFSSAVGLTQDDAVWMPSPLNHATGLFHGLITPMLTGGRAVLQTKFDAKEAVRLINEKRCTWSCGATPFMHDVLRRLDESNESVPTLRFYLCGGAPVPPAMVEHAARHGILLCELYGSTESCPHVHVPLDKCLEWNGRFSGIPYEGIEVRVVDEQRREVPRGVQGEEASRGPHQFVGYLNAPEETARALDDEGWFYSGDLCCMDEQGRIRINGRKKELIIRGGENISMREVDDVVLGCPGIADYATVGVPDERLGERICLFYVEDPRWEKPLSLDDVKGHLRKKGVAKRLWPERLERIEAIPRTATGKVKRYALSEELERRLAERPSASPCEPDGSDADGPKRKSR